MEFQVGGKDGWVVKPSEDYNHWAQRHKFQVNDILYFKYKKGNDSVLVVKKEDYISCNINNPIHKMDDENLTFLFDRSGLFFFISGNMDNCKNGQKLKIFVIAVRDTLPHATPPSQSSVSVPNGHGEGDGGGWSGGVNDNNICPICCPVAHYCTCC
ncbi:early nodulin-like protein 3 [Gastrolobium bilobum]|uniref:early nodulin-like protein 3 n=1 Tax=Gastrolobium bilobum TaxID=150636 RepID=UPI002AB2963D|nr:early nodulin-like protein 3 [Gastrolobium bilobum]